MGGDEGGHADEDGSGQVRDGDRQDRQHLVPRRPTEAEGAPDRVEGDTPDRAPYALARAVVGAVSLIVNPRVSHRSAPSRFTPEEDVLERDPLPFDATEPDAQ